MDKINLEKSDSELRPWSSRDDDQYLEKIRKFGSNDLQSGHHLIKIERSKEFYKMQKKKFQVINNQNHQKGNQQKSIKKTLGENSQQIMNRTFAEFKEKKVRKTEEVYVDPSTHFEKTHRKTSATSNFYSTETNVASMNIKLKSMQDQEAQILRTLYKPKSITKNADKFYGSLGKKSTLQKTQNHGNWGNKESRMGNIYSMRKVQLGKIRSSSQLTTLKTIVELKLLKYKPLKKMEKEKQKNEGRKVTKEVVEQVHVLDRIMQFK